MRAYYPSFRSPSLTHSYPSLNLSHPLSLCLVELKLRRIAVIGYVAYLAQSRAFSVVRADMDRCIAAYATSTSSSSSSPVTAISITTKTGLNKGQGKGKGKGRGDGHHMDVEEGEGDETEGEEGEKEVGASDETAREESETARDDTLMDDDDGGDCGDCGEGEGSGSRAEARASAGTSNIRATSSSSIVVGNDRQGRGDWRGGSGGRDGRVEDKEQADRLVFHMLQQVTCWTSYYLLTFLTTYLHIFLFSLL